MIQPQTIYAPPTDERSYLERRQDEIEAGLEPAEFVGMVDDEDGDAGDQFAVYRGASL